MQFIQKKQNVFHNQYRVRRFSLQPSTLDWLIYTASLSMSERKSREIFENCNYGQAV